MYLEPFHLTNRGLSPRKERRKEPTEFPLVHLPCSSLSGRGSLKPSKGSERGTLLCSSSECPPQAAQWAKRKNRPETKALPALGLLRESCTVRGFGLRKLFPSRGREPEIASGLGPYYLPPQSVGDLSVQFTPLLFSGGFEPLSCVSSAQMGRTKPCPQNYWE